MLPDTQVLKNLIREIAARELLPRFQKVEHHVQDDGSLLTEADTAMQSALRERLSSHWPGIPFLGEEMSASLQRQRLEDSRDGLWCLDPLDGTSNFAAGLPLFTVSLALIREGRPVLGLVHDPVRDETFRAQAGSGAWLNGQRLRATGSAPPAPQTVAIIDLKRLDAVTAQRLLAERPFGSQRNLGSCALEWAWLAAGRGHAYLHGGMKLWDYAAGSLILEEAGGRSATFAGEPVFQCSLEPRSVCAARDGALFETWLRWLHGPGTERGPA
jgi:myo-inositol-1(or 4)-monophosphatase